MRWTIGALAREAGVGVDTVRFYERQGVLPKPVRRSSGYREYQESDARRVRFIKRAQALGFTLKEIKGFLAMNVGKGATCGQLAPKAESKLAEIDRKIADLKKMRASLAELQAVCLTARETRNGRAACDCRVVDCFEEGRCT
jgi:DNA-binding transcriptional MerR regulator